jgi:hypothetical protein
MSKKLDFLRNEQSRQKHPERHQVGSPADLAARGVQGGSPVDRQEPRAGKIANDRNKLGNQQPSQTNQGRRTPESRHDRQTIGAGPQNQISARKGGAGAGRKARGSG